VAISNVEEVLQVGQEWPPESEKPRLKRYKDYMNLLLGHHGKVFNLRTSKHDQTIQRALHFSDPHVTGQAHSIADIQIHLSIPIPWIIGVMFSDILFSKELSPRVEGQEEDDSETDPTIQKIMNESEFHALNLEQAVISSILGDAVYELYMEDEQVLIESVDPQMFFPVLTRESRRKVQDALIAYTFEADKREFLRTKHHLPGEIHNQVFELKNSRIVTEVNPKNLGFDFEEVEELPSGMEDDLAVVHVPNIRIGGFWGHSDLSFGHMSLIDEIDNRFSGNANGLDKHGNPLLTGDRSMIDPKDGTIDISKGFVPTKEGGVDPHFLDFDSRMEDSFTQLDKVITMLCLGTGFPAELFLSKKLGNDEQSAKRLRLAFFPTLLRANRKKVYYNPGLKTVLNRAQKFSGTKVKTVSDLGWQDGLPTDYAETVDSESKRLVAGWQSIIDSIMNADHTDRQTAVEKYERIKAEKAEAFAEFQDSDMNMDEEEGDEDKEDKDKKDFNRD